MPLKSRHGGGGRIAMAAASLVVVGVLGVLPWSVLHRSSLRQPKAPTVTPALAQEPAALPSAPLVDRKPALAVLLFATIGRDPQQEHFAEGFTEDLAAAMARMPGMVVEALRSCATPASQATYCRAMFAAALAQSGLGDEARTQTAMLQRLSPGFTITENSRSEASIARDAAWVRHTAEGLRKAGLPD
ncbi:MAG: hypothetical protein EXQ88_05860 [Alphaproteobacteria bacterium]|nr:hypothetical protein [Alphaproteobacteria bacterium]